MRGDIFYASLNHGIGSEQRGYRPVLIIQNNIGNKFSPTVIVAVITGKVHYKARLPTHCLLNLYPALSVPSMVLLEQIITIDKRRLKKYVGRISEEEITFINKGLSVSVGLESL
jgi:Growth inhibitor